MALDLRPGAVAALYFTSFVLVMQSFLKIPVLHALAQTGSEAAFVLAQGIVLVFYLMTGFLAVKRFTRRRAWADARGATAILRQLTSLLPSIKDRAPRYGSRREERGRWSKPAERGVGRLSAALNIVPLEREVSL
jgi:hypothetical protein